jgi:hypothetical protein
MPVAGMYSSERPSYALCSQSSPHMMILGDILSVIVINKMKIPHLPINDKYGDYEKQADQQLRPHVEKSIFLSFFNVHG